MGAEGGRDEVGEGGLSAHGTLAHLKISEQVCWKNCPKTVRHNTTRQHAEST